MTRGLWASWGGFGNHLRWLLLLDTPWSFNNQGVSNVDFVKQYVYPNDRSWHNWLYHEWQLRDHTDNLVPLSHNIREQFESRKNGLHISLVTDPDLAYKSYVKFNSNLNNHTVSAFKHNVDQFNRESERLSKENSNLLILDSSKLFTSVLDKDLYTAAANWFRFPVNYEKANDIHSVWYNLHKKAEQELVRDLQQLYKAV